MNQLMVYLKTTDTCQLNCDHCFTSGSNGKKGFLDVEGTIDFFKRLHKEIPVYENGNIAFHGGEPFLCPTEKMFTIWNEVKDLWPNIFWSIQTNLTFKLTQDKKDVLEKICNKSWGTSWDYGIRWKNPKHEELWRANVKELAQEGHEITVMVSLSDKLIRNVAPIDIIDDMASLGVKYINFERITPNGNALLNFGDGVIPRNHVLDHWFMKMWEQTKEKKAWEYIENLFLDSVLTSLVHNTYSGCRSRGCEQKILTLNADGRVGGCPNSATDKTFGTIHDDIQKLLNSEGRLCNINAECTRHNACATCDVYDICNGDCHQLKWEGDICAAPKSLMQDMKKNVKTDFELYKNVLNGFMGQE